VRAGALFRTIGAVVTQRAARASVRRVVVLGRSGAGKTTLALRIGAALRVPVIHLDGLFWNDDWTRVNPEVFDTRQAAAAAADAWVIDGNYASTAGFRQRLARAECIVIVDAPAHVCLWRVLRRRAQWHGATRPDVGAPERIDVRFLDWVVRWGRRHPGFVARVRDAAAGTPVRVVRSARDADALLADLQA